MNRAVVSLVAAAFVAAINLPARAQDRVSELPASVGLADTLRLARERNPELKAASNAVEAARADRVTAGLLLNPALTFDSEGQRTVGAGPYDEPGYSLRLDQEVLLPGRRGLRVRSAEQGIAAAESSYDDTWRRLALQVRQTYFRAALAKADREVAQTALDEIDKVVTLNRARFEQGEISGVEFRRLQVERLRFVDDVFSAELAWRTARTALLALLNVPDLGQPFDVSEPLAPPDAVRTSALARATPADAARLQRLAQAGRPDVASARRELERAATETRLQRALRAPNPTVGFGYRTLNGVKGLLVGITVPVPLFARNQGAVARAEAGRRQAENRAAAAAIAASLEVQQALNAVDVNRARVEYIEREYLKNARETRDIVLASYRIGAANLIDFLDAQRAFRDTLRTHNRALYEYRVSVFQLEAATGAERGGVQ